MAVPVSVMRRVKSFLDVVVERVGDASAGFIILLFSFASTATYLSYVHFVCVALIVVWVRAIYLLQTADAEALRKRLLSSESLATDDWLARTRDL